MSNRSKIYALECTGAEYEHYFNLGDDIQSLAVSRFFSHIDGYVPRDALNQVDEECVVLLNGYFLMSDNWPPSPSVKPVFFGFHVRPESHKIIFSPEGIGYLKKWQPIGCRDIGTMNAVLAHGIEAFYSKCPTLTLPKREKEPEDGKIYIVGVGESIKRIIPKSIRSQAINIDQGYLQLPIANAHTRHHMAEALLEGYSRNAKLIITTRIHCAMPCIAMGIPVVFLYEKSRQNEYRIDIIKDFMDVHYVHDSPIFKYINKYWLSKKINWQPCSIDIEQQKEHIKSEFKKQLDRVLSSVTVA